MNNESMKPFIKLFKTPNATYLYSVNRNKIVEISDDLGDYFYNYNKEELREEIKTEFDMLNNDGMLSGKKIAEIKHPMTDNVNTLLDGDLGQLILQITQSCNLSCMYCPYANHSDNKLQRAASNKIMDIELARKAVDFFCEHSFRSKEVSISFYGGEPLICFNNIKEIVEYASKLFVGKKIQFNMTTNGTLMTKEMMEYIVRKKINIMFSIDGPEKIHDIHRKTVDGKGSFKKAFSNFLSLKEMYGKEAEEHLSINMVLDSKNDINEIIEFSNEQCFDGFNKFEGDLIDYLQLDDKESVDDKYTEDINYQYFLGYLDAFGIVENLKIPKFIKPYFYMMEKKFFQIESESYEVEDIGTPGGPCIPGQRKLFVSVEGEFYPCEKVNELSDVMRIGDIEKGFNVDSIKAMLNISKLTEDKCRNCWAYRYCGICARVAEENGEYSATKKNKYCESTYKNTEDLIREYLLRKEIMQMNVRES